MKPSHWVFASLMGLATALPMSAAPKAAVSDPRVQVEFVSLEKFTDLKADASGSKRGRDSYLEQLRDYLVRQAGGQDLSFKITNEKGKVLREGVRELKNLSFMRDVSISRQDPLRHEKKLLDDWLRREVAGKS